MACRRAHVLQGGGGGFVESCLEPTRALKECMEANPEYYAPMLEAEAEALEAREEGGEAGAGDRAAAAEAPARDSAETP